MCRLRVRRSSGSWLVATTAFVGAAALVADAASAQSVANLCRIDARLDAVASASLSDPSTPRLRDLAERHGVAAPSVRLWIGRGRDEPARRAAFDWLAEQRLDARVCLVSQVVCAQGRCAVVVVPRAVAAFELSTIERDGAVHIRATVNLGELRSRTAQIVALSPGGHTFSSPLGATLPARESGVWRVQLVIDAGDGPRPWAQRTIEVLDRARTTPATTTTRAPTRSNVTDPRTWLVELNRRRTSAGLPTLRGAPLLAELAQQRARERSRSATVAHVTAPGDEPDARLAAQGIRADRVAENIVAAPSLEAAFERLEQSPSHRRVRYEPSLDSVAIGMVRDETANGSQWYVVELYASHATLTSSHQSRAP